MGYGLMVGFPWCLKIGRLCTPNHIDHSGILWPHVQSIPRFDTKDQYVDGMGARDKFTEKRIVVMNNRRSLKP